MPLLFRVSVTAALAVQELRWVNTGCGACRCCNHGHLRSAFKPAHPQCSLARSCLSMLAWLCPQAPYTANFHSRVLPQTGYLVGAGQLGEVDAGDLGGCKVPLCGLACKPQPPPAARAVHQHHVGVLVIPRLLASRARLISTSVHGVQPVMTMSMPAHARRCWAPCLAAP